MAPAGRPSRRVLARLRALSDPAAVRGMSRFGINDKNTLGISVPALRAVAREVGRDHALAAELWASGIHEARILASMVDDPAVVDVRQMDRWVRGFDSWDACDQVCMNLFRHRRHAYAKAVRWSTSGKEFTKRAGFALMAGLAAGDKSADDARFLNLLPHIVAGASDDRNFVKKAVNWALRQIGKRSRALNRAALKTSGRLASSDIRSARWVGIDALRELERVGRERGWSSSLTAPGRAQRPFLSTRHRATTMDR